MSFLGLSHFLSPESEMELRLSMLRQGPTPPEMASEIPKLGCRFGKPGSTS